MLSIKDVSMTYQKGQKEALKNINLEISEGEFTALLGQNGAGKSTLINILAGNVKKTRGAVSIGGYDIDKKKIQLKEAIKTLGTHIVQVKLHTKVTADLKVVVTEA